MNIVKVIGGLGNQMFQYAFYHIINKKSITKLDTSSFSNYNLHNGLEIDQVFGLNTKTLSASQDEIEVIKDSRPFFRFRKLIGFFFFRKNSFIKDSHYLEENYSEFNEAVLCSKAKYLEGYWQNENYFLNHKDEIQSLFTWRHISEKNIELATEMRSRNSVAIHIRRFDHPKSLKQIFYRLRLLLIWRVAKDDYYFRAINYTKANIENPYFYVFTDNIPWVKKNVLPKIEGTLINWNRGADSSQDMFLMTQCKHNIISMSTFSWWGAWLNTNKDKLVVAPKKWAVKLEINKGIIPKSWIKL